MTWQDGAHCTTLLRPECYTVTMAMTTVIYSYHGYDRVIYSYYGYNQSTTLFPWLPPELCLW